MKTLQPGDTLVVASHNPGKVWEISELIKPYGLKALSAGDLDLPEPEETEETFHGNAKLKALSAATRSGHAALADDSGLEVDVLDGEPGIYSARWAGAGKDFQVAMTKVAAQVEDKFGDSAFQWDEEKPDANFICVLCLAWPGGETELFEGRVDGHLVWPPRGGNGFGYDPMFVANGMTETFGEIEPQAKHALSHRRRAFDEFEKACLSTLPKVKPAAGDVWQGLAAAAANLSTQAEFAQFADNLSSHLKPNSNAEGENEPQNYLAALARWAEDAAVTEDEPKWRTLAKALLAAAERT